MTTALALLQAGGVEGLIFNFLPIIAIVAIFYFMVIAPANKQRRKTQEMLAALKKGDKVVTSGGIYGTVQGVESDIVHLKIAENVKVKVLRSAIVNTISGESSAD